MSARTIDPTACPECRGLYGRHIGLCVLDDGPEYVDDAGYALPDEFPDDRDDAEHDFSEEDVIT